MTLHKSAIGVQSLAGPLTGPPGLPLRLGGKLVERQPPRNILPALACTVACF